MCSYGSSVIAQTSCSMQSSAISDISSRVNTRPVGIVRRVDDDRLGPRRERLAQAVDVERPVGLVERHEHRRRAGENRVGAVVLVERLEDDHFVARIDQRHEHGRHRFRRAAGHRHLAIGIDFHADTSAGTSRRWPGAAPACPT